MNTTSTMAHGTLRNGGYGAIHKWLKNHYGKADRCESVSCDTKSTAYQWAKLPGKEYEHQRENFIKLCASCHRKLDMTDELIKKIAMTKSKTTNLEVCKNGHKRTPENTYWAQRAVVKSPVCRICQRESQRRYICRQQV